MPQTTVGADGNPDTDSADAGTPHTDTAVTSSPPSHFLLNPKAKPTFLLVLGAHGTGAGFQLAVILLSRAIGGISLDGG
ncbi:hypothetical protein GCM10029964_081630 [Kibdelosporangium lantanae]